MTNTVNSPIRLNSLGFLPRRRKQASIAAPCATFRVIDAQSGTTVFTASVGDPSVDADTGEEIQTADFSALREPGSYILDIDGVGRSCPFRIADDVYRAAFSTAMRAMYLWRCGAAVSGRHNGIEYSQAACHLDDGFLDFVEGGHIRADGTGGWHDAGDYNKYVVNAGITVASLFLAWEHFGVTLSNIPLDLPEAGGTLPEFLAEIKWEIDWLLKMQLPDGRVSHKLSTQNFCGFIMPAEETQERFFTPWSTSATADFAAVTAIAARIFSSYEPEYARRCLAAARKSYEVLRSHPENFEGDLSAFSTGGYGSPDDGHRLWAASELWAVAGDASYLSDFELRAQGYTELVDADWDWNSMKNHGLFTYLLTPRPGRDSALVKAVTESLLHTADGIVDESRKNGYARPLRSGYYWGCNGTVARQTILLRIAHGIAPNEEYLETSLDAVSYLFGRNPYGRSFVTGLGHNPPMHPHDRRSGADGIADPWPGYLVGGGWPKATDWNDVEEDYKTNEIAINWNSALIYALAGFVNG